MAKSGKAGKGSRKIGKKKDSPSQKRYTNEQRWLKNKSRRIARYIKKHPNWKYNENTDATVKALVFMLLK